MEAHITLEIRSENHEELVEKIKPLFDIFEVRDAIKISGIFNSEQWEVIRNLVQSFGSVLSGLEYSEISNDKAAAGLIGGWESEVFAANLARVIFLLGFDDFEIVVVEDESVCVTGVYQMAVVREYFDWLETYQEDGFQFPEIVEFESD